MRRTLLAGAILSLLILAPQASFAEQVPLEYPIENGYYFDQTGHTVRFGFWDFYRSVGGARILGYPLSEEFTEDGTTVQYFERARLEFHPEAENGKSVAIAPLGEWLTASRDFPKVQEFQDSAEHRYFRETGYPLSYGFKRFWEANGRADIFGYPISREFKRKGKTVQFFQRARFEFNPQLPEGQQVQLGLIGRQWSKRAGHVFPALDEKPVQTPEPMITTVRARITGYTSLEGGGRTATGKQVCWGIVAVDPRYIPLGSKVWIQGFPGTTFYAEDTGSAVKGWWVDVWVSHTDSSLAYAITGYREVTFEPPR